MFLITFLCLVAPWFAAGRGAPISDSHRTAVIELLRLSRVEQMIEQSKVTMIDAITCPSWSA